MGAPRSRTAVGREITQDRGNNSASQHHHHPPTPEEEPKPPLLLPGSPEIPHPSDPGTRYHPIAPEQPASVAQSGVSGGRICCGWFCTRF